MNLGNLYIWDSGIAKIVRKVEIVGKGFPSSPFFEKSLILATWVSGQSKNGAGELKKKLF